MPAIMSVLAPGFADTPDRMDAAIALARVTFPYLPLISLAAFWAALANAHGRFMAAAAMPLIFNICMIGGALVIPMASGWLTTERAMPVAAALLIAGVLQLGAMGLLLRRRKLMPRWRMPRFGDAARRMWRTFGVASAGGVVMQVNLVIDLVLASLLPVGAVSWLYFADRVAQLPLGIFGIALGTALLPRLSAQFSAADHEGARASLAQAILFAAFLVIPATAALVAIAPEIVTGLFAYGAFSTADAAASAAALAAYAAGMPAHIMVKILQPAFYAYWPSRLRAQSVDRGGGGQCRAVAVTDAGPRPCRPCGGDIGIGLCRRCGAAYQAGPRRSARTAGGGVVSSHRPRHHGDAVCSLSGAVRVAFAACGGMLALLVAAGGSAYLAAALALRAIPRQLLKP